MRLLVSGNTKKFAALLPGNEDVFGILVTPQCGRRVEGMIRQGLPWGADNAAFVNFNPERFRVFIAKIARKPGCLFLAVPDSVGDARATLALWDVWEPECRATGLPLALVGQDGLESLSVPWERFDALFIGGSTRWKESHAAGDLMMEAARRGKHVHCGRVNSRRRMGIMLAWGANSIDGTGMSKFGDKHLGKLLRWRRELGRELAEPGLFGRDECQS